MAKVETRILSPQTTFAAYLIFKLEEAGEEDEDWWGNGFDERPVKLCIHLEGREDGDEVSVFLDPSTNVPQLAHDREDRWKEIEMGEFFNKNEEDSLISCSLKELSCTSTWSGLIVEGIVLRPRAA
ncbi:Phloem protein [Trema orientale]|uniref:Phloem protein n=1 Tax=Trema orientale TaxID=63057 RepID=A0A2P5B9R9_TREOI|nr:Phloem protein [Trema orientale]